jgi:hypothetical protein
MKMPDTSRLLE